MAVASRKRLRLDPSASPSPPSSPKGTKPRSVDASVEHDPADIKHAGKGEGEEALSATGDEDGEHCVICLHTIRDRTILPCAHDRLCFDCIFVWCQQSRKCPLCNAPIGSYLIHHFRSEYDYSKYYLQPLPEQVESATGNAQNGGGSARQQSFRWGPRRRNTSTSRERQDDLEVAISRRRSIYQNKLFAKHVASNPYTRYRPAPTPAQISASPDLISRATIFIRRELRVWINLDVEFLTTFIISLMKSLDLRSESAIKLLAEFLDMDTRYFVGNPEDGSIGRFPNAEHFAHELYSYLRSPFRDLAAYDSAVEYDTLSEMPSAPRSDHVRLTQNTHVPPKQEQRIQRGRARSPSPICHLPRDAYSRSPSPANSDAYDGFYGRYTSAQQSKHIHHENSRSTNTRDVKGKGRASPRSIRGVQGPPRDERPECNTHYNHRSESTIPRSPVLPPASGPTIHSPSFADEADPSPRPNRTKGSDDPSPSPAFVTANTSEDTPRDFPTVDRLDNTEPSKYAGHDTDEPNGAWGISIKGQAKLLLSQESVQKASNSHSAGKPIEENSVNSVVSRKRPRNPADVLHAHLGHSYSDRRAQKTNDRGPSSIKIPVSDMPEAAENRGASFSDQPLADCPPSPSTSSRISARDIMIRTRAKLAQLRAESSQTPLIDVVPSKLSDVLNETQPDAASSTVDLRTRLIERLDQEKLRAKDGSASQHVGEPSSDRLIDPPYAEGSSLPAASGNNDAINTIPSTHQLEKKLRTQTLLRMRLAAEKKKIDVVLDGQGSEA